MFDGPRTVESFIASGEEFFGYYRDICGLQPHECMLDVGCGIGRKTVPLVNYLTSGSYWGFDCKHEGIDWCNTNIASTHPNFHFQHVDVYAPGYHQQGLINPTQFKFPFKDNAFDLVVANSVFTHMQYYPMCHYLAEIQRVLRTGGRCLLSYFIIPKGNEDVRYPEFHYPHECGWMEDCLIPEKSLSYEEGCIRNAYEKAGLDLTQIYYGTWSGRKGLSYQDLILAHKW
jgi:ubiquinone/menaquinone biosynthesis C-methylase UbiE